MYCPQCGGANNDSVKYCSTCGYDLEEYKQKWGQGEAEPAESDAQPGATPAPYVQATAPAVPAAQQPPAQTYQAPYQAPDQPGYPQGYQQPYQSQPPYQGQYQPQPPYGYGNVPKIPSYMGWAIVTLILCFWPTGIVAVVYAAQVGNKLAVGDFAGAKESSRKAKLWCWITFGIAIAGVVIAILIAILAAAATFQSF